MQSSTQLSICMCQADFIFPSIHHYQHHTNGSFYLSKRSSRVGRNQLIGEGVDVSERDSMAFRPSLVYTKRLREHREKLAKEKENEK